jgi:WD40 repeat protein/serine/threonine protein kinase/DNA-binding SARP family transcriptional activator
LQAVASTLLHVRAEVRGHLDLPNRTGRRYRRPVRFGVLGPLEVAGGDGPLPLGGPKQRTVLAHLILNVNQVVPADHLIDALWSEGPPEAARGTLQAYVSRLRSALGSAAIEGRAPGYVLHADPEDVDAVRFERLLNETRRGIIEPRQAALVLGEALELWRGPALADLVTEPSLSGEIARFEELRLQATEERIAAQLELGQHAQTVAQLEILSRAHPLRERLWSELMLSLYRLDRQAEALAAFERARTILADELGIDPSHELQELHQRILRQDLSLDLEGEPLRGYRLLEQIGEGAFGVVYRALQPQVGREVAIKAVHPELANHPDFVRRFEHEAQIVARLEHPHIVPLYDYWREPDAAYLVMRFLRGGSVETLLEAGALEPTRVASIVDQIGFALAAAHRQGVVHRDVKPGNILLDEEGNGYLTDFGVALDAGSLERSSGTMMRGTPAYLSPEQIRLDPASPQSDVYALGIVAYEMLTGSHPFPDTSLTALLDRHLRSPMPSVRDARPDLAGKVDDAIARATAKDTTERFAGPLEFAGALRAAVEGAAAAQRPVTQIRNPYKGLRAFLEPDASDFFGREALTKRLVRRLQDHGDGSRFLAVVGPSGSGKSSVVRAGLVPALRGGALPGSDRWYVVDLLPGPHPLREIEKALLGVAVEPPPSLLEELERDTLGLLRAAQDVLPDADSELVIVIDQLEEVFTLLSDEDERSHLLASLRAAVLDPGSRVRIVVTLRADFYDEPLMVPGFGDLLAARTEAITPMSLEELERAIVSPADRSGLVVEPGLLAAIFADIGSRPSALPLLQYALTELAEHHDDGILRLGIYRRIGGAWGALARRAERIFESLNEPGRYACRQLFLRLVTLGDEGEATRRRVRRSELLPLAESGAMDSVMETYGRHRLLSFDRDPDSREPTVEIAHEALLQAWSRLHGWVDDARNDLRTEQQLSHAAGEWAVSGRDESFLLRGARLEQIATWVGATSIGLTPTDDALLRASIARRDEELAREQARLDREAATQRRSRNRLRALVAVFAVAALVAGALTVVARTQSSRAERESRIATARELAAAAESNLEVDPERSILLALEAVRTTRAVDGTVLREAEEALHRAVQESRVVMRLDVSAAELEFSPDGSRLATAGDPDVATGSAATEQDKQAFIWDTTTGERVLTLSGHTAHVMDVHFSPDGSRLATGSEDGTAAIWDARTGERLLVLPGHAPGWVFAYYSPDGRRLLTTDTAGVVRIWDARDGELELEFSGPPRGICGAVFSPDGTLVAGGTCVAPGNAFAWDAATGERVLTLRGHEQEILDVAFSPDGSRIATASPDGTARVWDASIGKQLLTLAGHEWALGVDFSADGKLLATAGIEGTARVWDARTGRELLVLSGHTGMIADVDLSPDGTRLATGSGDGTVRIWDIRPEGTREQMTLAGLTRVQNVAYSPDGAWLATTSADGRARLWDSSAGRRVQTFSGHDASFDAAFAPDGATLVTSGFSGPAILWDTTSAEVRRILEGAEGWIGGVAFSPDGTRIAAGMGYTDSGSGQVLVWDARTGRLVSTLGKLQPNDDHVVVDLDFSPDGRLLAAANFDGTARVWDLASGEQRLTLPIAGLVVAVAFSPDGRSLATAGSDGTVRVWDVSTGEDTQSFQGHVGTIRSVAFSPDGKRLASASLDNTARLWDLSTGREVLVLTGQTLGLTDVAFSPDGTRLAISSNDGTVRVYVLPIQELIDLARSRVTRNWTEDECNQYLHLSSCPSTVA